MRYAFIKMHQKACAYNNLIRCRVQEVSKTGYYDWGKRCPGVRAASIRHWMSISEKCLISIRAVMVHRASPMS